VVLVELDVEALRAENAAQRVQIAQLVAQVVGFVEQVAKLNDRVAELLAVAQRKQRKPSPPPVAAAPVALDAAAKVAFDERPTPPPLPDKPPKKLRTAKPSGRKPLPPHLPVEDHALRPDQCAHCGGTQLDVVDEVVEEKLHVVKEHQRRRVVRRTTCRCRDCLARTTPPSLPAPYERSKVTCDWLAWFVHQKFGLLAPLDRIRRDLAERGIPLAMGTLVNFVERAADLLAPVDGVHWKQLLAGSWMATDGTGLKVLVDGLPAAHDGYIELYRDDARAVFQYEATKAGPDVVAKLASFVGTLTADAEHRFNAVYQTGRVVEAGCNAHGRRKFRDAEAVQPVLAAEGGAFIAAMYVAEQEARNLGLVGDALLAHRQARIRPVLDDFARWLVAVEPTLLPSDPLRTAVTYYRNHWAALTRFVDDAAVPM
jgi:transposase